MVLEAAVPPCTARIRDVSPIILRVAVVAMNCMVCFRLPGRNVASDNGTVFKYLCVRDSLSRGVSRREPKVLSVYDSWVEAGLVGSEDSSDDDHLHGNGRRGDGLAFLFDRGDGLLF